MKKLKPFIYTAVIFILLIAFINEQGDLVENLQIPVGAGYDIQDYSSYADYQISLLIHSYGSENEDDGGVKAMNRLIVSKGKNIPETREKRQLKSDKAPMIGLTKVQVLSESIARFGIRNIIDIWINNPQLNDRGICVVCKGKAEDIINYPVKGSLSSVEYIEGMVRNSKQFNFFPMQYSIMDIIVRVDAEGRTLLLPYIEATNEGLKISGLAIFKGDKLVAVSNIDEARIINILHEKSVKGTFTLQKDSKEYMNFFTASKRKVRCSKKDGKYSFVIDLDLKGQIISNELNENILNDTKELKKVEEAMKNEIQDKINKLIKRIKEEYKVDFLGLGKFAAAKYGRGTGVDWNEIISDSNIEINVKFSVDTEGRGSY